MLKFFDYVYYRVCKFYYKHNDAGARFSGIAVLALMQCLNLFTILILVFEALKYTPQNMKLLIICSSVILILLNGIRYNRLNYDVLNERWKDEDERIQKRKGIYVKAYIIFTFLICILLIFR